jgi:hypothetical protein
MEIPSAGNGRFLSIRTLNFGHENAKKKQKDYRF